MRRPLKTISYQSKVCKYFFFMMMQKIPQVTEEEFKKATKLQKGKSMKEFSGTKKNFKSERDSRKSRTSSNQLSNHYSLKNDAKKSSNSSTYRDSSKRSTLGAQSMAETKYILESQIANRQYQLVNALTIQAEKKKVNNWDEITKRLSKVLQLDLGNKKNSSRVVKTHILISNSFLGKTIKQVLTFYNGRVGRFQKEPPAYFICRGKTPSN